MPAPTIETMQELTLASDLMFQLETGHKHSTIRSGIRDIRPGHLLFRNTDDEKHYAIVEVSCVEYTRLRHIDAMKRGTLGWITASSMINDLRRFYPTIDEDSLVTIVYFGRCLESGREE